MLSFDFQCPTRIMFGPGTVNELGRVATAIRGRRNLLVTDPGIITVGHAPRAAKLLEQANVEVVIFDGVAENPTTEHIDAGLTVAKEFRPKAIVAVGGGSSMDCAKGINFLYSCGGRMQDYRGEGKATGQMLPMIAVPTTAGTGSETQSYALITDAKTHVKMACGDKRAAFRAAILDAELTVTQPPRVTALTGIDAIAHAIETYVTKRRSPLSLAFSREAWRHLAPNYIRVVSEPQNIAARAEMQLGAALAGLAIENSMLGAAHALANPLTTECGIVHGEAVAIMLPHVIRHNGRQVEPWYRELVQSSGDFEFLAVHESATELLAGFVSRVSRQTGLAGTLSECGVVRDQLQQLAKAATEQWTGTLNPVAMSERDYSRLYEEAL